MLTENFYSYLALSLKTESDVRGSFFIAVGNGDPAWDQNISVYDRKTMQLVNEHARKAIGVDDIHFLNSNGQETNVPSTRLRIDATFTVQEGVGIWRECGLFSGDATGEVNTGRLLAYYIYPRIEKLNGMVLKRSISLDLSPQVSGPGQIVTRYLGNSNSRELHDLENETGACRINKIRFDNRIYFGSPEQAIGLGYDYCAFCFGRELSQR